MWRRSFGIPLLLALVLSGCRAKEAEKAAPVQPHETSAVVDGRPVILAFGDSLTAGHGVELAESYPALLQKELDRRGYAYRVVNAGVSGDTTSGGLARIDFALAEKPKVVVLELGANDGLRGLPVPEARRNLERLIEKSRAAGAEVVLAGMTLPLNFGPDYIRDFEAMYASLAKQYKLTLIPFFLEGVAGREDMNQMDGIHPTARGYVLVTQTILKYVEPLLQK